jgi:hypothetical protein
MKKYLLSILVVCVSVILISWGATGHRTIGKIAENHLTPQAQAAIKDLLDSESLADVSTYADKVRSQEKYKYTSPWHYIDVEAGLSESDFKKAALEQNEANVYQALAKCENDLIEPGKSREEKIFALKFIVHMVGDLHQPMHVSRKEDQGGNKIKVTFLGKPGNLHGLWDSGLPEHEGLSYDQLAVKVDHATKKQIKTWQQDDVMTWLYESYQISEKLYADAAKTPDFDEAYYKAHIPVFEGRMAQAGIRLAGVLNEIFKGGPYNPAIIIPPAMKLDPPVLAAKTTETTEATGNAISVPAKEVAQHINATVTTSGTITSTRLISSNNMTLLNIGNGDKPDFTIAIKGDDRSKFGQPEIDLKGKTVTVTGKVIDFHGRPEIFVSSPEQIKAQF